MVTNYAPLGRKATLYIYVQSIGGMMKSMTCMLPMNHITMENEEIGRIVTWHTG